MRLIPPAADLHMHSHFSDGKSSPQQLLDQADGTLSLISICDHDTIQAYEEIPKERLLVNSDPLDPALTTVLPGIEISARVDVTGEDSQEIHLLGYFPQGFSAEFTAYARELAADRTQRVQKGVHHLRDRGVALRWQALEDQGWLKGVPCRSHVSRAMQQVGFARSAQPLFKKFLGREAFSAAEATVEQAIQMVNKCGGIPVWAHPHPNAADRWVERFCAAGLRGLEVFTASRRKGQVRRLADLAEKHQLLMTGGSDFHGLQSNRPLGTFRLDWNRVPQELLVP